MYYAMVFVAPPGHAIRTASVAMLQARRFALAAIAVPAGNALGTASAAILRYAALTTSAALLGRRAIHRATASILSQDARPRPAMPLFPAAVLIQTAYADRSPRVADSAYRAAHRVPGCRPARAAQIAPLARFAWLTPAAAQVCASRQHWSARRRPMHPRPRRAARQLAIAN